MFLTLLFDRKIQIAAHNFCSKLKASQDYYSNQVSFSKYY